MDPTENPVIDRLGLDERVRTHHPFRQEPLANQPVFAGGEDVGPNVDLAGRGPDDG